MNSLSCKYQITSKQIKCAPHSLSVHCIMWHVIMKSNEIIFLSTPSLGKSRVLYVNQKLIWKKQTYATEYNLLYLYKLLHFDTFRMRLRFFNKYGSVRAGMSQIPIIMCIIHDFANIYTRYRITVSLRNIILSLLEAPSTNTLSRVSFCTSWGCLRYVTAIW